MAKNGHWHITGWPAFLIAPILLPVALVVVACVHLFGLKNTVDRTPAEVEGYLRDFLDGTGGAWDWDDFTSIGITDPDLDYIREEAALLDPPFDEMDENRLRALIEQTQLLR
ncbi:hypothetical protein [Sphingobium sp. CAP-1]|uniref:hypothetical protein n=1 Tax=Sphingobium sp. CAP-1 TaxID=2676077 RepID=UPI0012BB4491|nr:hypothetical protein [Sphingobium sp. CAP-1]QGP78041.1 hypothetical protein GL174_02760 [Sphingobium sp. CAP-1]